MEVELNMCEAPSGRPERAITARFEAVASLLGAGRLAGLELLEESPPRLRSPAAPSPAQLDPLGVERDVDGTVLDLYLVLRDGLHGGQALGRAGLHVEPRAVERTFHLRALELAIAQVRELVGTDVLEGVKLAVDVAQGHEPVLDPVLFDLPGCHLARNRQLVKPQHGL